MFLLSIGTILFDHNNDFVILIYGFRVTPC